MWPFTRKPKALDPALLQGWTDWHSHLLPGVDDGIRTMEDALAVLQWYEASGVQEVWLTPHIMVDCPNTTAELRARFAALRGAWTGSVRLHLAAEHMLDALFEERLRTGDVLPLGEAGDHLLVETSCYNPPMNLSALFSRIRALGFYPVLAHPERYFYMEKEDYRRLHEEGVVFQLNLPSLAGYYGPLPARKAAMLQKAGWYSFTGSDLHSLPAFRSVFR